MGDIKDILESVLNDEKLLNSRSFRDKVYSDEPIIKRASQIKTPAIPQKIKDMKALAYSTEAFWKTSEWLFYKQGTFMADFTDVYEYTDRFYMFCPTYRDLSYEQLRGYFSWRTRFRNGLNEPAPLSFVDLLTFEIINNIGVKSPESGFEQLMRICEKYPNHNALLPRWIADYALYYELPQEYLERCSKFDTARQLAVLIDCENVSDDALFGAMTTLSGYNTGKSRFIAEYPDKYMTAAVRIFRKLSEFYAEKRKNTLCDHYFGKPNIQGYRMFEGAVFYDTHRVTELDRSVCSALSFRCRNGIWSCSGYFRVGGNKKLGRLMKAIDKEMRDRSGFPHKLRETDESKSIVSLIRKELDEIAAEKAAREAEERARNIKIDLGMLSAIRAEAEITRDKLLTEDDLAEAVAESEEPEIIQNPEIPEVPKNPDNSPNSILTSAERAYLTALLNGGDHTAAARDSGMLPSVLADSINEKLFDFFADTVIEFDGDIPRIIEDYADDLTSMTENGEI